MTITVPKENDYDVDFVNWLIEYTKTYIISSLDEQKLKRIDSYIKENKVFQSIFKKTISSKDAIFIALNNLKFTEYPNRFVISINPNSVIPGTQIKVLNVSKLINFGTLSILGYPIFVKNFKYIEDNLETLYEKYEEEI